MFWITAIIWHNFCTGTLWTKDINDYNLMQFLFLFICLEPTTRLSNKCLQIMVASCGLLPFFIDFRCLCPKLLEASPFSYTLTSVYWQLGMLKGSMKKKWLGQEVFFSCVLCPCLIPIPFPADFWERLPQSSVSNSVLQNDCPF